MGPRAATHPAGPPMLSPKRVPADMRTRRVPDAQTDGHDAAHRDACTDVAASSQSAAPRDARTDVAAYMYSITEYSQSDLSGSTVKVHCE